MNNFEKLTNEFTDELDSKGFHVYKGWDDKLATKIVEVSRQQHIVEHTPNDYLRRFRDIGAAAIWHNQGGRSVYSLRGDELAGLIWYDIRIRPDLNAQYTFAIRMYEGAVGRKLAHGFMKAAHIDFATEKGNPSTWLETDQANKVAVSLYDKFGYQIVQNTNGRLTMVYHVQNSTLA